MAPQPRSVRRGLLLASGLAVLVSAPLVWRAAARAGTPPPAPPPEVRAATEQMAALLVERAALVDPSRLSYVVNDRRADVFKKRLESEPLSLQRYDLQMTVAMESLNAGRIDESLQAIEQLESDVERYAPAGWAHSRADILLAKALAYMRMAELQNCCE